jgi:hypothetical protein
MKAALFSLVLTGGFSVCARSLKNISFGNKSAGFFMVSN